MAINTSESNMRHLNRHHPALESHTPSPIATTAASPISATPVSMNHEDLEVPSYEVSQRLHEQQQRILTPPLLRTRSGLTEGRKKEPKNTLKLVGLRLLNARQHFALACSRDVSLIPCIVGLFQSWSRVFAGYAVEELAGQPLQTSITSARMSEHFLTGVWCIVAGYLTFALLDGLMIRWIVTYSTSAAIVRMLSMSTIIITIEQYLLSAFSADGYKYGLHIWILISCCLTVLYFAQNFITLNLDLRGKSRARFFDFYNIAVFAVVPVGLASFITMIILLQSLLILRLDVEERAVMP